MVLFGANMVSKSLFPCSLRTNYSQIFIDRLMWERRLEKETEKIPRIVLLNVPELLSSFHTFLFNIFYFYCSLFIQLTSNIDNGANFSPFSLSLVHTIPWNSSNSSSEMGESHIWDESIIQIKRKPKAISVEDFE